MYFRELLSTQSERGTYRVRELRPRVFKAFQSSEVVLFGNGNKELRELEIYSLSEKIMEEISKRHDLARYPYPEQNHFQLTDLLNIPLSNAFEHGNNQNQRGVVGIEYHVRAIGSSLGLSIEVSDQGKGFDYDLIRKLKGKVILSLHELEDNTDNVEYNASGNKVTVTKIFGEKNVNVA